MPCHSDRVRRNYKLCEVGDAPHLWPAFIPVKRKQKKEEVQVQCEECGLMVSLATLEARYQE